LLLQGFFLVSMLSFLSNTAMIEMAEEGFQLDA
jgi:hypothetical protein